jgi:hypothetical protein
VLCEFVMSECQQHGSMAAWQHGSKVFSMCTLIKHKKVNSLEKAALLFGWHQKKKQDNQERTAQRQKRQQQLAAHPVGADEGLGRAERHGTVDTNGSTASSHTASPPCRRR